MSPAFIAILLTVLVLALGGAVVALTAGGPGGTGRRALPVPASWIVLGAILLVLGVVVVPKLFGFMFLFLPMIWTRRARGHRGPRRPDGGSGSSHDHERDPRDEDR